jgi:hypothetical protein
MAPSGRPDMLRLSPGFRPFVLIHFFGSDIIRVAPPVF